MKKQFTNRILSLVLSIMMVVSMLPMNIMTASAAETTYPYAVVDTEAGTVTIDGTLGGKTTATEEDITVLVNKIQDCVDNGITTIIVTGSNPAMIDMVSWTNTAIGEAIYRLSGSDDYDENNPYNGKIDLILPDVTEIVDQEFYGAWALNSITLPKVIKIGNQAFHLTWFLKTITFESVLTEVNETGGVMFAQVGKEVEGCDLILNCGQMNESSVPAPDLTTNTWKFRYENEFKSITLTHSYGDWVSNGDGTHTRTCANDSTHTENGDCSGGTATCTTPAICEACGVSYGEVDSTNHASTEFTYTANEDGTTMLNPDDDTDLDNVIVKATCLHPEEKLSYRDLGTGTHNTSCADCGTTFAEGHSGGKASCIAKAVCDFCGASYGELADHSTSYSADGMTITYKCATCDTQTVIFTLVIPTGAVYGGALEVPHYDSSDKTYQGDYPEITLDGALLKDFVPGAKTYEVVMTWGDKTVSGEYTIAKADQAAPTGLTKTDTTYFGKADGKISGLTSAMEFRKEGDSTYTAGFNGTLEYLAAGTYYVRYQGDANHNPSPDAVVNVNDGRKLQIVVPQNQVGYTVTVNKTEMEYEGSYTLKVEIHEGYTATEDFKIIISNWECGQQAGVEETYMNAIANQIIEVRGVADITPPAAEIKVKENKWTSFWNNLTFGLFFKETQDVRITANDKGVGMDAIYYYLADSELELDEVKAIADWQEYNGAFQISPNNRYVIYAKAVDKNGNTTYINSAKGIVLDSIAPVLNGIENGGVYHGDKIFKAVDDNFLKIEVDGVDVTDTTEGDDEYKIVADNAEHTVTVTDKAGNVTEIKITVYKRYMVTYTDGEGSSYEKEFDYGEVITIPTNDIFNDTFRRGGYTLTGWQGYTEGMTMPLSPVTLTALYKPKQYIVSFNANGGETIEPITVTFDEKYGNLPSSAIAGLSGGNKNWYLIDAYGNVTETNIKNLTLVTTARDHTLFIKRNVLAPNISITLAVPGGISDGYQYYIPGASQRVLTATVGNMNTDILDYAYKWYKDGALIEGATSNVLTLDGNVADSGTYKVEVTATLKDGTNIVVNSDMATASKEQKVKILHATNTISYDANGGEAGPQSSYTGGATLKVSKDVPNRTHYDFIGWNTKPDGSGDSYKADELYTFAEDNGNGGCVVTLYAQWKLVEHTVTYTADGQIIATEKVEHGKDATLPDVPAKDGYVGKWDADGKNVVEDTTISVVYTAISVVKPDEVKPGDKTDLEDTKAKLEEMLDDDYSDDDKKNIQEAIDSIDNALEVIGNVEAVEELIDKLPENITKNDEATVKAADDAYNALTDYEKSLVDKDAKKALDDAKAVLAELNKPTVPNSPQTGDNSNLWLWFVLMFVSGSGIFGIALYERKRKVNNQR